MSQSNSFWNHPIERLEEALSLRKQIAALQDKLSGLFGSDDDKAETTSATPQKRGKRTMSAATIAKMRASQQARWAKKGGSSLAIVASAKPNGKRAMSPEAREKIAAAQRARWAKTKESSSAPAKAAKAPKKKGGISPEGRAKLAAAMKARWAARRNGAAPLNTPKK